MDKNTPTSNSNVVEFPKDRIFRIDAALGQVSVQKVIESDIERLKIFRHRLIREYLSQMVPMIFNCLGAAGFQVNNIKHSKNAAMLVEALRAFMEKEYGIVHDFHKLADVLFDFDENNVLCMNSVIENVIVKGEENNETSNVGDSGTSVQTQNETGTPDGTPEAS